MVREATPGAPMVTIARRIGVPLSAATTRPLMMPVPVAGGAGAGVSRGGACCTARVSASASRIRTLAAGIGDRDLQIDSLALLVLADNKRRALLGELLEERGFKRRGGPVQVFPRN